MANLRQPPNGRRHVDRKGGGVTSYPATTGTGPPLRTDEQTIANCCIKDLVPHVPNTVVVGLVISKQSIQSFPDKKNPGSNRYKFSIVVRDSPNDYINVTVWGSEVFITRLFSSFNVNDIVQLCNCQISSKSGREYDDKWSPWTPSQFQLNVSESYSTLTVCNDTNHYLSPLAHVPLRPSSDYYTLTDIQMNGTTIDGTFVNILAGIKSVGNVKEMVSKSGRPLKKCEIKLIDDGCNSFTLLIWDSVLIELAQSWTPRQNIIFGVDVKVGFDQYRNTMTASCTSRTLITCNPDCPEAHRLYQYLQTVDQHVFEEQDNNMNPQSTTEIQSITDVYTVSEIQQLMATHHQPSSGRGYGDRFSKDSNIIQGITYALITSLDNNDGTLVTNKCSQCKFRVPGDAQCCTNQSCPTVQNGGFTSQLTFDLSISLSDHSGTVQYVRMSGEPANELLQTTPSEFLQLNEENKAEIKLAMLLERYKIYFKWSVFAENKGTLRVIHIEQADLREVLSSQ